ncbi:MAG: hypothetical protein KIT10_02065 [Flavobacteriales bacterium]|nr:hypothetical protein [Flavobacteriales bacterium]
MYAFRVPALFSLFRQRGPREFHIGTRYYDPLKEQREERLKRTRREADARDLRTADRELFAQRMRHSWRRQSSDRAHIMRLVVIMGLVIAILYFIVKGFGLLGYWNA